MRKKAFTYKPSNNSDELNPEYMLQGFKLELLVAIANGKIDVQTLAKYELANMGRSWKDGQWVGFDKAESLLGK